MTTDLRAEIGIADLVMQMTDAAIVLSEKRIEAANPLACQAFRISTLPAQSPPDELFEHHLEADAAARLSELLAETLRGGTGRLSLSPDAMAPGTLRRLGQDHKKAGRPARTLEIAALALKNASSEGLALLTWRFDRGASDLEPAAQARADATLHVTAISARLARELGCHPTEAIGRSILEPFHPEDQPRLAQLAEEMQWSRTAMAGEVAPELTASCRLRGVDGEWRWYRATVSMAPDPGLLDVSLQPIERIGEDSRFDRLFGVATDLLCILDERGCFLRVNDAWQRLLGLSSSEMLSRSIFDFVHRDDVMATLDELQRCESAPGGAVPVLADFINRFRHADRGWHWLSWRATLLPELGFILCSARDVTERRYTAEALRSSEEKFRAAAEGGLDAFFILEARRSGAGTVDDLVVVDVNARGEEMVGAGRP